MEDNRGKISKSLCDHCKEGEIYHRRLVEVSVGNQIANYEGLCVNCFQRWIEQSFLREIRQTNRVVPGDHVLLAMSGGKDSQVMAHIFSKIREEFSIKLSAVTVDPGIMETSAEVQAVLEKTATDLDLKLHTLSFSKHLGFSIDQACKNSNREDVSNELEYTPCSLCGGNKLRIIMEYALEKGYKNIALGVNLDDIIADFFLYMSTPHSTDWVLRIKNLVSPSNRYPALVAPLLRFSEEEIIKYAELKSLKYLQTPCPYSNWNLSRKIRPEIASISSKLPGYKQAFIVGAVGIANNIEKPIKENKRIACEACGSPKPEKWIGPSCPNCATLKVKNSLQLYK